MKKLNSIASQLLAITVIFVIGFGSCAKPEPIELTNSIEIANTNSGTLVENFEIGTKTSYAGSVVNLATGPWFLNDALLGTLANDRKNGTKSVRLINSGQASMRFNFPSGIGTIDVFHAVFGTDGPSTWELHFSTNDGQTWTRLGNAVTSNATALNRATFSINHPGAVRFEIRKVSGGTNRINIDDFTFTSTETTTPTRDSHLLLGNPSGAVTSTVTPNNYLMVKDQYILSYNDSRKTSNWVSWHLSGAWLGNVPRQDDFRADPTLPAGWIRVTSTDYTNSGFDRGHMCPSADRTASIADNSATFLMTNIIPQAPNNNQITWVQIENYCRALVNQGNELYIITGPWGQGGTGSAGSSNTISSKNIVVPSHIWKVIVVLPLGSNDLGRISNSTRIIAVWTPNTQTASNQAWSTYRTSVDFIESQTGFDFLSNVSASIQSVIEASVDNGPTQ